MIMYNFLFSRKWIHNCLFFFPPLSFPRSYHWLLLNFPPKEWNDQAQVIYRISSLLPPFFPSLPPSTLLSHSPAPAAPVWIDCSLGLLYRGQPKFSVHHDARNSLLFSSLLDSLFPSSNIFLFFGLFFPIASPERGLLGDKFAVTLHVWKCIYSISHWLIVGLV